MLSLDVVPAGRTAENAQTPVDALTRQTVSIGCVVGHERTLSIPFAELYLHRTSAEAVAVMVSQVVKTTAVVFLSLIGSVAPSRRKMAHNKLDVNCAGHSLRANHPELRYY